MYLHAVFLNISDAYFRNISKLSSLDFYALGRPSRFAMSTSESPAVVAVAGEPVAPAPQQQGANRRPPRQQQQKDGNPDGHAQNVKQGKVVHQKKDAPAPRASPSLTPEDSKSAERPAAVVKPTELQRQKRVSLFSHLPQYEHEEALALKLGLFKSNIHKSFVRLGLHYASGAIQGSTSRCMALLQAFVDYFEDYITPPMRTLSRDMADEISVAVRIYITIITIC